MEILTVVEQHRSYDSRRRKHITYGLHSSPSQARPGINCRAFESQMGILPAPSYDIIDSGSPQVPYYSDPAKQRRRSNPIPTKPVPTNKAIYFDDERWAGPAYSNSPPPSSLPLPNFSLRQRSMSFEIPILMFANDECPPAKSAPPSPGKESYLLSSDFFVATDLATKGLRRILNLDS